MKEADQPKLNIIEILNESMRWGSSDPDNYPTVEAIAERMGIDNNTLHWWLENDREFQNGLTLVKEIHDKDPWKDSLDEETKLDAATLSFGVSIITTRFHITTRLRFLLRDFKVYTHERAIKQRGDRHESKNETHHTPRHPQTACQWTQARGSDQCPGCKYDCG